METLNARIKQTKLGFIGNDILTFDLILDVQGGILDIVAIGEELISEVHIRLAGVIFAKVACENLHEGEEIRIGTAHVLDVRIGDEQLVAEVAAETAVEVNGDGAHVVLHGVHGVVEHH